MIYNAFYLAERAIADEWPVSDDIVEVFEELAAQRGLHGGISEQIDCDDGWRYAFLFPEFALCHPRTPRPELAIRYRHFVSRRRRPAVPGRTTVAGLWVPVETLDAIVHSQLWDAFVAAMAPSPIRAHLDEIAEWLNVEGRDTIEPTYPEVRSRYRALQPRRVVAWRWA